MTREMPSTGKGGNIDPYPFVWEAYVRETGVPVLAVARPHRVATVGEPFTLDGGRSWNASGRIARYEWLLDDGRTARGQEITLAYDTPGTYSEVLRVTDAAGNVDYDAVVIQVFGAQDPQPVPAINANYYPTEGIQPGDPVTFTVRVFNVAPEGEEVWDFGDGSGPHLTGSKPSEMGTVPEAYATSVHRFQEFGDYIVRVKRDGGNEAKAIARLHVRVGECSASRR